jgi:ceramide glucosyltransferase
MLGASGGTFPFLLGIVLVSVAYAVFALLLVASYRGNRRPAPDFMPPVTILKPLCGSEPYLLECLRSFCVQDYPDYQIVFGVRVADDPIVPVIEQLRQEHPDKDISLVIDGQLHGSNRKTSNLANMLGAARHDIFVISDSDVRVARSYLRTVVAPFGDLKVGAVTCLYTGTPTDGLPSVLAAMFINDWFLPSVLVAVALGKLNFCFGQTMAVRRDVLDAIGGFTGLAPYLADDYMLGKLVSDHGFEVRLAEPGIENIFSDPGLASVLRRELRWSRTYRTVRPVGYVCSIVTDTTALALLYLLVSRGSPLGLCLFGAAIGLRLALHKVVRSRFGAAGPDSLWLVPIRDLLCFGIRIGSFLGRRVEWRGEKFVVLSSGRLETKGQTP